MASGGYFGDRSFSPFHTCGEGDHPPGRESQISSPTGWTFRPKESLAMIRSPAPSHHHLRLNLSGQCGPGGSTSSGTTPSSLSTTPSPLEEFGGNSSYYQAIHFGRDENVTVILGEGEADCSEASGSQRSQDSGFSDAGRGGAADEQIYEEPHPPPMPSPIVAQGFGCGRIQGACDNCLSCSAPITNPQSSPLITLPNLQPRRSFSPSALAQASTHTALAALRVPLSSSTPKRGGSGRLNNRIDNFESLNKNLKDTNNNSGNKGKCTPSSNNSSKHSNVSLSSSENMGQMAPQKKRSAAESIYDKICHRLSSFSVSSTQNSPRTSSSQLSPLPPTPEPHHEERPIDVPPCLASPPPRPAVGSNAPPVVRLWLSDLRSQYEPECLHSLQNKWILPQDSGSSMTTLPQSSPSLSSRKISSSSGTTCSSSSIPTSATSSYQRRLRRQEERRSQHKFLTSMTTAIHAVSTPLMSIRTVEMTANLISAEFSKICKHLEFGVFTQVPTLVTSLTGHITDFLRGVPPPSVPSGDLLYSHLKKLEDRLEDACFALSMAVRSLNSSTVSSSSAVLSSSSPSLIGDLVEGIVTVGNLFSEVVDLRLTRDLGQILDTVEGGSRIPARIALRSLVTVLADGGSHICRLAADIRTVRGLLGVLLENREDPDKTMALRGLSTVLCVGEAVKDFDKAGGFEIICDLLADPQTSGAMKLEAVAVLTQATDPWIDLSSSLVTLSTHLPSFISSLTGLISPHEENFLLISAAISNLTFLEPQTTSNHLHGHLPLILKTVSTAPFSVFVLDHIATILANTAGHDLCRPKIIASGGIPVLLHFLSQSPSNSGSLSAVTATERLQQKSTIALSRLANEPGVAQSVYQAGGIHRLIILCRQEKERNYSDGVLIAALATLRKLVSLLGPLPSDLCGASDLLEPRLLDSFLLYSSRQESYV